MEKPSNFVSPTAFSKMNQFLKAKLLKKLFLTVLRFTFFCIFEAIYDIYRKQLSLREIGKAISITVVHCISFDYCAKEKHTTVEIFSTWL